jgi:hypothetical protein
LLPSMPLKLHVAPPREVILEMLRGLAVRLVSGRFRIFCGTNDHDYALGWLLGRVFPSGLWHDSLMYTIDPSPGKDWVNWASGVAPWKVI